MIVRCEVSIHAQPAGATALPSGELQLPADWASAPWGRTFDEALEALSQLPQLYTEPDGSFVWTSGPEESRWQLFGCLYDRGAELAYVDLFGACSSQALPAFLACLRGPQTQLMVQQRERGVFLVAGKFVNAQ